MKTLLLLYLIFAPLPIYGDVQVEAAFDIGSGKIKMQVVTRDLESLQTETLFCNAVHIAQDGGLTVKEGGTRSLEDQFLRN